VGKLTGNIDLRPTFSKLAGADVPASVDGHSLVPLLHGAGGGNWRVATLVEHHGRDQDPGDPDFQSLQSGNPTTYEAIRTQDAVYVEYKNGDREYYDLTRDPYELDNTYADLGPGRQARLHDTLTKLEGCSGQDCWVTAGAG
jgi:arylsulfatase A-like enzyme